MNKQCMKKGHVWKLKLSGWVCSYCRKCLEFDKCSLHEVPHKFYGINKLKKG